MPSHKPTRLVPGASLVIPRVTDKDTQRALDQVAVLLRQLQSQMELFSDQRNGRVPLSGARSGALRFLSENVAWEVPAGTGGGGGGLPPDADYGDVIVSSSGAVWTVDALPQSRIINLVADLAAAVTAARMPAFTGDVTTSAGSTVTAIAPHVVTAADQAQMAPFTVKANNTGSTADEADITVLQVLQLLGVTPADVGDGSDGSPVFDGTNTFSFASKVGSVYTLTKTCFFDLPTINAGVTLKPDSWPVRCRRTPINNGLIDISGGNASGGSDGAAASSGSRVLPVALASATNSTNAPQVFVTSSAANGGATAGGAGHNGAAGTDGTKGRGGGGGAGGNNNPFTGQGASGENSPSVALATDISGDIRIHACASSGRNYALALYTLGTWGAKGGLGGAGTVAGGRGAAGGYLYWASPGISGTGVIQAKGGNGGNGTDGGPGLGGAGGGAGGAGGIIVLALQGFPNSNTTDVSGGLGGGHGGHGTDTGSGLPGNGGDGARGGDGDVIEI